MKCNQVFRLCSIIPETLANFHSGKKIVLKKFSNIIIIQAFLVDKSLCYWNV